VELKKLRLQITLIISLIAAIACLTIFDPFQTEHNIFPLSPWSYITISIALFTSIYFFIWLSLSIVHVTVKDEPTKKAKFNPHIPFVSIILPCRNEAAVISNAIKQALNQTYENLEVIVVAHNCIDNTAQIARQHQDPKLKILELTTQETGKGLGLKYAAQFAKGDVIVYFDTDSIIPKEYVEKIINAMYSKGYDVVQGKIVGANADYNKLSYLQHMENQLYLTFFWGGKQKLGLPSGLGGTGVAIRKQALEKIGGFRNVLVEDFDLCVRAQLEDFKVGYCKDAVIYDEKVPYFDMLIRQRSRWMAGHFQLTEDLIRKRKLTKLFRKNPVDFFQLLSPFYTFSLWIGIFVGILSYINYWQGPLNNSWITFWYAPLPVFILQTIMLQVLFILVLRKECQTTQEFRTSILNLPLFYFYTMHWFIVFWKAVILRRKTAWASTKTEHGFRR
jgi:cellulose synthase/poly-beta-1,6-N-acetylglucosamine synthase-like glycosyltransferase